MNGNLNCDELKDLLHPYADGELDLVRTLAVERHLQDCSNCTGELKQIERLRQALGEPQLYHRAGLQLRERILSALPRERRPLSVPRRGSNLRRLIVPLGLAASFVLVAFLTWAIVRSRSGEDFLEREVAAAYVRSELSSSELSNRRVDVKSSNTHNVKPWFTGKLDFSPTVKDLKDHDYPLVGGRVDYVDDRTVAVLVYNCRKHVINLFQWPAEGGDRGMREMSRQGYNLIHWQAGGFTYWAISDLNAKELREFAEHFRG